MKTKNIFLVSFALISLFSGGCKKKNKEVTPKVENKDISIVYTTDVHCGINENLGYSSLYKYKEDLKKNNYVALVDSGDYLQGDLIGAISNGKYIIDIMNEVEYDVITIGNHEFDYGTSELSTRLSEFKGDVVSCNFTYTGTKENKFNMVEPYVIKEYGDKKVGFIGITTPQTLVVSDPKHFYEDDELVYSFGNSSPDAFYSLIQNNIDECKSKGANYVVLLSHLGSLSNYSPYRSIDVLEHTSGVTAFLDGHAHADVPWKTYKNKNNEDTLLVDTGYKLNEFASLTIKVDGSISYDYVTNYSEKSEKIDTFIKGITDKVEELENQVVANIDVDLLIGSPRLTRIRETTIGNLVADAYRTIGETDIGFVNGGGVRADLHKGDVTYKDIKSVHPFGNTLLKKKTTGAKILDYLEFASMKTPLELVDGGGGKYNGESGAFASVSGLKYTIDTSISNHVITDENGAFIKVEGERRVKNVQVLENGEYKNIDPEKNYTISSHNFLLESGGDGANMFINDEIIGGTEMFDYEVVIKYIVDVLQGHLADKYSSTEGRITVI